MMFQALKHTKLRPEPGQIDEVTPNASTNSSYFNGLGTRVKRVDTAGGTRVFLHDGLAPADNVVYDGSVSFTPGVCVGGMGNVTHRPHLRVAR